jgi:glutamate-5-semialdehyde dehydrogenase
MTEITQLALRAREAARALARTSTAERNGALVAMAAALVAHADRILAANAVDM